MIADACRLSVFTFHRRSIVDAQHVGQSVAGLVAPRPRPYMQGRVFPSASDHFCFQACACPRSGKPPSHPRADTPSVYTTHLDFWGFLFRPSPHLYPLEVGPHCGYRKSGEAHLGSPAGQGRARPPNVFCCILGINVHPFDCLMTNNFLCFCRPQESFRIYL